MKSVLLCILGLLAFSAVPAQTTEQISSGKLSVSYFSGGGRNSLIRTEKFTATGGISDTLNGYWNRCLIISSGGFCGTGDSVILPVSDRLYLGRGTFTAGDFTLGSITYPNVFYDGYFDLTRETFFIPKVIRKGFLRYSRPFEIKGRLIVCRTETKFGGCDPEDVIYDAQIHGHGTVNLKLRMRFSDQFTTPFSIDVIQDSIEYIFES